MVCSFLRIPSALPETNNQFAPENGWLLEDERSKLPIYHLACMVYIHLPASEFGGKLGLFSGYPIGFPIGRRMWGTCRGLDRFQLAQRPSMPTAGMVPGGAMPGAMPGMGGEVVKS